MEKYTFDFEKAMLGCPVVTRNGRPAKILDYDYRHYGHSYLLVKITNTDGDCFCEVCDKHGKVVNNGLFDSFEDRPTDLFLADDDYHWDELKMIYSKSIGRLEDERIEATKVHEYTRGLTEFEKLVRDMLWVAYNHDDWTSNVTGSITDNEIVIPFAEKLYEFVRKELGRKKPKGPTVAEFASKLLETVPKDAVVVNDKIHYIENGNVVRFEKQ